MTATYDGAVEAIKAKMSAGFNAAPVAFQNSDPPANPWPPADGSAFVYVEVLSTQSKPYACGTPGKAIWRTLGLIHAHVHVGINAGDQLAQQYARAIGDVFRNQRFYNDEPPNYLWTIAPQTDGGGPADNYAGYWRVTATINFELYLQG